MGTSTLTAKAPRRTRLAVDGVWLVRVLTAALIFGVWEAIARSGLIPKEIFPSIIDISKALLGYLVSAEFYRHLSTTAFEVGAAFVIGGLAGLVAGLFGGMSRYLGRLIDPYLHYLAPTPKIIFLPLFLLMFGIDMGSKIALGVISAFFPVAVATLAGMRHLAPVLVRVGESFRLSTWQMITMIYLPAMAVPLSSGLGLGLGSAMTGVLLGECKMSNRGVGFLVIEAYRHFRISEMYALLALCFSLAVLLTAIIDGAGRRFQRG